MNRKDRPRQSEPEPSATAAPQHEADSAGRSSPPAEVLIAATLALMTGVVERAALAQPLADHAQSLLMATKVRAHLHSLSVQPQVSPGFRETLARLRLHWDRLAGVAVPRHDDPAAQAQRAADASPLLWMTAPSTLQ